MNTQGENVNVRIVAARVQDQVTAVSNVLRSHETVLSQVYSTLEEFTNDIGVSLGVIIQRGIEGN